MWIEHREIELQETEKDPGVYAHARLSDLPESFEDQTDNNTAVDEAKNTNEQIDTSENQHESQLNDPLAEKFEYEREENRKQEANEKIIQASTVDESNNTPSHI